MKLRIVIVDDDLFTRESLRGVLACANRVEVIAESADWGPALELIRRDKPDVVFLSLNVCGGRGLEDLAALESGRVACVVMAGDAQQALAALEARAVAYLLKPIAPERCHRALQSARDYLAWNRSRSVELLPPRSLARSDAAPGYLSRVKVKADGRILFLRVDQVAWVEAADNYVVLHVGSHAYRLHITLNALEAALDPQQFVRVSRSALVNADCIAEIRRVYCGKYAIILQDGTSLSTRRPMRDLAERLNSSHRAVLAVSPRATAMDRLATGGWR